MSADKVYMIVLQFGGFRFVYEEVFSTHEEAEARMLYMNDAMVGVAQEGANYELAVKP